MLILFIFGLVLGIVSVIFSLQNILVVTVNFFRWEIEGPLSAVLLVSLIAGFITALLLMLPGLIRHKWKYGVLQRENKKLEEDLKKQKELTHFAKNTPPTDGEIEKIEKGAIDNGNDDTN